MGLVLLVSYSAVLGGAERVLIDSAIGLEGEICLACPPGPLADAATVAGMRPLPIRYRTLQLRGRIRDQLLGLTRLLGHGREIRQLVRDLDPELVIVCGMRPALGALLVPRIRPPVIFEHHDFVPGPIIGRLVTIAARRAAIVVAPSRAVADELSALDRRVEPLVVHPGVEIEPLRAAHRPATPPEIVVLGALVDWKRPDLALEVCSIVRKRRPDARLRFVGTTLPDDFGAVELQLRQRAADEDLAGAVEFVGSVADPRSELERSSLLLHCSPREPFGLAIVEALASQRPAVVPAAGGPAEIVDQTCGIQYPPGDAAAAARAVLELLSDPGRATAMGKNGRNRAAQHFDRAEARGRFQTAVAPLRSARPRTASGHLALLTVTHNSAHELGALLDSAQRHLPDVPVIVVDSASQDETLSVAQGCGQAVTISLRENVGFGRACNRGLAEVGAPVTALVNPDVELIDDSLLTLATEALSGDRPPRLLAPLVLNADGSRQDTVHPRPGSLPEVLRTVLPPRRVPGRMGVALAPWRATAPRRVGWAVGCALVARTDVLRTLGPFDERIFLFGEDLDLGLAAAERGIGTWFWPSARVVHKGAHSTRAAYDGEPFERLAQARHRVVLSRLGPRRARADLAAQAATFASRIVIKRALRHEVERERQQLAALSRVSRA